MTMYFKITNENECHNGYQYHDGLNILPDAFNSNPHTSCCKGGFYFTKGEYIHFYYGYGKHLRIITLPENDKEFKMVKDPDGDKWRANRIILGEKYYLSDPSIYSKFGIEPPNLRFCIERGYKKVVETWFNNYDKDEINVSFTDCITHGDADMLKILLDNGKRYCDLDNCLSWAAYYNKNTMVKLLLDYGAKITGDNLYPLQSAIKNNNYYLLDLFLEKMNSTDVFEIALYETAICGNTSQMQYLLKRGVKISAIRSVMTYVAKVGDVPMMKLLLDYESDVGQMKNMLHEAEKFDKNDMVKFLNDSIANGLSKKI